MADPVMIPVGTRKVSFQLLNAFPNERFDKGDGGTRLTGVSICSNVS